MDMIASTIRSVLQVMEGQESSGFGLEIYQRTDQSTVRKNNFPARLRSRINSLAGLINYVNHSIVAIS